MWTVALWPYASSAPLFAVLFELSLVALLSVSA